MLKRFVFVLLTAFCMVGVFSAPAFAEEPHPGWEITSHSLPTNLRPGNRGIILLYVFNVGGANSEAGKPITVTDMLPEGVTAVYAGDEVHGRKGQAWDCVGTSLVRCTNDPVNLSTFPGAGFPIAAGFEAHSTPPVEIEVTATGGDRTVTNRATVAGGGALGAASTSSPLHISSKPAPFGIANWDVWFSNADGTLDTQAGSHPYDVTFDLEVNSEESEFSEEAQVSGEPLFGTAEFAPAGGELRNTTADLPPGFVGNPTAVPQCARKTFDEVGSTGEVHCSPNTVIGFATTPASQGLLPVPIYNLVPPPGVAAQFGFNEVGNPVFLDSSVRTGGDYGIRTHADNTPQGRIALGAVITLWGVPGDPSHNTSRCSNEQAVRECASSAGTAPLLTLPTECTAPQPFTVRVNEWQDSSITDERTILSHDSNGIPVGFTGCEHLSFGPSIIAAPDTPNADTPAGLTVEVRPPLGGLMQETGLSTSDIQSTRVTLPEGVVINPGQAAGLQACKPGDVEGGDDLPLPGEDGEEERFAGPPDCPSASRVGTVTIQTPLLEGGAEKQLEGGVYVLQSEPPELKLLVAASADGVNVKLVGVVHLNEQTGRLETTFEGTPELPFSDFKLSFSGGARAGLDTPTQCGTYQTTSDFKPWSAPLVADAFPTSEFAIGRGSDGGSCPSSSLPFSPQLVAGSTTDQAGGYTDFSLLLQRGDGQQRIDGLQFKAPEGLTGMLSRVPLCTNAEAETNTCPETSKIGHTVVESGPGPYPLVVPEPGQPPAPIYLTESYGGAPFGLSIVVPLRVGPFVLPTQRVRAKIEVDPITSQLTVTTDPLPQMVAGVPTDLREIDAVIERPEFMVNPTDCRPKEFTGTAYGTPPPGQPGAGVTAAIGSHFQMGSCRSLQFHPKLSVRASSRSTRANGTSVSFKLSYPPGAIGKEAWLAKAKFDIPKQLPARLSTLQKSCPAVTFNANPANCASPSRIGTAVAHTELLPVPLQGPVYFVSNGGAKFPEAVLVLQGDGVTVDVHGETFINEKTGVTSATFPSIPDDPFESVVVTLPSGRYSEFTVTGNLCKGPLKMPTAFVGQNGAEIHQSTPITVTGCTKAKHGTKKKAKKRNRGPIKARKKAGKGK